MLNQSTKIVFHEFFSLLRVTGSIQSNIYQKLASVIRLQTFRITHQGYDMPVWIPILDVTVFELQSECAHVKMLMYTCIITTNNTGAYISENSTHFYLPNQK